MQNNIICLSDYQYESESDKNILGELMSHSFAWQRYMLGNESFVPVPAGGHLFVFFWPPGPCDFPGEVSKMIRTGDFSP